MNRSTVPKAMIFTVTVKIIDAHRHLLSVQKIFNVVPASALSMNLQIAEPAQLVNLIIIAANLMEIVVIAPAMKMAGALACQMDQHVKKI